MKQDSLFWIILTIISILVMGILGWWNYIQTDYNKFILILISAGVVLVLSIWRKGVSCQGGEQIFDSEE